MHNSLVFPPCLRINTDEPLLKTTEKKFRVATVETAESIGYYKNSMIGTIFAWCLVISPG